MRTNPKSDDCAAIDDSKGPVVLADPYSIDGSISSDAFEIQTVCVWVEPPQTVGIVGAALDVFGQFTVQFPEGRGGL